MPQTALKRVGPRRRFRHSEWRRTTVLSRPSRALFEEEEEEEEEEEDMTIVMRMSTLTGAGDAK